MVRAHKLAVYPYAGVTVNAIKAEKYFVPLGGRWNGDRSLVSVFTVANYRHTLRGEFARDFDVIELVDLAPAAQNSAGGLSANFHWPPKSKTWFGTPPTSVGIGTRGRGHAGAGSDPSAAEISDLLSDSVVLNGSLAHDVPPFSIKSEKKS